jgi:hypothetical protein
MSSSASIKALRSWTSMLLDATFSTSAFTSFEIAAGFSSGISSSDQLCLSASEQTQVAPRPLALGVAT